MRTMLLIVLGLLATSTGYAVDAGSPAGLWRTVDDKTGKERALVRIVDNSGVYEGRVEKIFPQPDDDAIHDKIEAAVYGIGPGHFTIADPVPGTADGASYLDLSVTYTQSTDMLLFPGPDISVTRSKRVWVAS